jgi:hypothetical protein
MDQHVRLTAGANAQRSLYGGDTSARRAINMVTQRCPTEIDTSARWQVAQSAENDATAAGFGAAQSPEVFQTDASLKVATAGRFPRSA